MGGNGAQVLSKDILGIGKTCKKIWAFSTSAADSKRIFKEMKGDIQCLVFAGF